jgi:rubrerythrin
MPKPTVKTNPAKTQAALENLLYQTLECEMGGVQIYTNAIRLAVDEELRQEWEKYLVETKRHVEVARGLLKTMGLDPDAEVPARLPVRLIGETLVQAMMKATGGGDPMEAQIAAAECVVLGETKDHADWELLAEVAKQLDGPRGEAFAAAVAEVERQEDHHLYHTKGWARELRLRALGLPAVIPPPEERQKVESAVAAAQAKASRGKQARPS